MKVRCKQLFGPTGSPQQSSPWLTIGAIYEVLTVELHRNGQWHMRLMGDSGIEVGLFPVDGFEVTSRKLPPSWVASWTADGFFQLAPEAWLHAEFWERFYDRDPEAVQIFETELAAITATS